MNKTLNLLIAIIFSGFFFSCAEGDREKPGQIKDLVFFIDPSALIYDNGFELGVEQFPAKTYSLAWTATGDNKDQGEASLYDLRWISSAEIKEYGLALDELCNPGNSYLHYVFKEPFPKSAGSPEIFSLMDLTLSRADYYYFCLWAIDEIGQRSLPAMAEGEIPFLGVNLSAGETVGLGEKVGEIGDFSLDGLRDIAVSSKTQGKVFIYFGRNYSELFEAEALFGATVQVVKTINPDLVIEGSSVERFGAEFSNLGDLDKNGKIDLAISAPESDTGSLYLFQGDSVEALNEASAWAVIQGENSGDRLGAKLADCGDLNQDGYPDFAVLAEGAGKVYIVLGGDSSSPLGAIPANESIDNVASVLIQGDSSWGFGSGLDCGEDLNGDGFADILIGAETKDNGSGDATGAVYLLLGGETGTINFNDITARNLAVSVDLSSGDSADLVIYGVANGDRFGADLAMLGDVIGRSMADLSRDFAVGAPGAGNGKVYIFYGGPSGNLGLDQLTPPESALGSSADLIIEGGDGEVIGELVSGKADLNQDGHRDLGFSVGANGIRVYYLVPGEELGNLKFLDFDFSHPISRFSLILDFDRDARAELLAGMSGSGQSYLLK